MKPDQVLDLYPPHDDTLGSLLASRAQARPEAAAIEFDSRAWSYGDLDKAALRLASALVHAGIRPGDRIAHIASNSDIAVLLFLAAARAGAIFVPMNPALTDGELAYLLGHSQAALVAAPRSAAERIRRVQSEAGPPARLLALEDLGAEAGSASVALACIEALDIGPEAALPAPQPDDVVVVIYTSGTTGLPKGVMHSHRNYVLSAEAFVGRLHLQPDDRLLTVFPLFHINALFYSLGGALAAGAAFVTTSRFSASSFWKLAVQTRATQFNILAALGKILGLRPRSEFDPTHRIRKIYGGPISDEMYACFRNEFGVPVLIEGYGMSEIPAACSNPFEGPHKPGSIGKPGVHPRLPGRFTEMQVRGEDGSILGAGQVGELMVRTPVLFKGYLNDPQQTAASFADDWFHTGDLVRVDEDGYYHFVARKKDIIRRRGENISGAEIDLAVGQHPEVAQAAAIGVPSEMGEDEILVAVVARPGAQLTHEAVIGWCRQRLAAMKVPRFVLLADALPSTPTHRVAKHLLKQDHRLLARARDMQQP